MSIRDMYVYHDSKNQDQTCIGINQGKWHGVVYKYGDVSFGKEEDANGHLPLRFKYDIVDNNGLPRERFTEEFFKLIGDILVDIMERQVRKNDKSDN